MAKLADLKELVDAARAARSVAGREARGLIGEACAAPAIRPASPKRALAAAQARRRRRRSRAGVRRRQRLPRVEQGHRRAPAPRPGAAPTDRRRARRARGVEVRRRARAADVGHRPGARSASRRSCAAAWAPTCSASCAAATGRCKPRSICTAMTIDEAHDALADFLVEARARAAALRARDPRQGTDLARTRSPCSRARCAAGSRTGTRCSRTAKRRATRAAAARCSCC